MNVISTPPPPKKKGHRQADEHCGLSRNWKIAILPVSVHFSALTLCMWGNWAFTCKQQHAIKKENPKGSLIRQRTSRLPPQVSTLSETECPILKGGPPLQAKPEGRAHRSVCFDFQYLSWYSISEIIFKLASGCRVSWNSVGFLMYKKVTILVIVSLLKFKKRLKRRHNEDPQETAFSSSIRSSGNLLQGPE